MELAPISNSSFLITVLILYGSLAWLLRSPSFLKAFEDWRAGTLFPDPIISARVKSIRLASIPDLVAIFLRVGESYFVISCVLRFVVYPDVKPGAWVKPACFDLHLWGVLVLLLGLRWSCQPDAKTSLWQRRCISALFTASALLIEVDLPPPIRLSHGVGCIATDFFAGEPWFGLGLRFFLIPVTVMLNSGSPGWLDEETSAGWSPNLNMIFLLMNEVMVCGFTLLILQNSEILLGKQQQSAMDLENQVRQREIDMKATEDVLSAARQLLSVTCDCCEQLTPNWEIVGPSQRALCLLQIPRPEEDTELEEAPLQFLQFVCAEDRERFKHFAANSESQAPTSIHLRMQTYKGRPFEAQIFHVNFPGALLQHHLIGICKANDYMNEMLSIPEETVVLPPRRAPAAPGGFAAGSVSSGRSSSSGRSGRSRRSGRKEIDTPLDPRDVDLALHNINQVSLEVDLQTSQEGYGLRCVELGFADPRKALKLRSWISSKALKRVEGFLQAQMNAWYHNEKPCEETCEKVRFQVPGIGIHFTAQQMSVAEIVGPTDEDDERDFIMRLNLSGFTFH